MQTKYRKFIAWQKKSKKELYYAPLFHLLICYRANIGNNNNAMVDLYGWINKYRKMRLDPFFRIRLYIIKEGIVDYRPNQSKSRPLKGNKTYVIDGKFYDKPPVDPDELPF